MPFITTRINVPLSEEQEARLVSGLGRAIEFVSGKLEQSLVLDFEDMCRLRLRGDGSRPMAYVVVAGFENCEHHGYRSGQRFYQIRGHRVLERLRPRLRWSRHHVSSARRRSAFQPAAVQHREVIMNPVHENSDLGR